KLITLKSPQETFFVYAPSVPVLPVYQHPEPGRGRRSGNRRPLLCASVSCPGGFLRANCTWAYCVGRLYCRSFARRHSDSPPCINGPTPLSSKAFSRTCWRTSFGDGSRCADALVSSTPAPDGRDSPRAAGGCLPGVATLSQVSQRVLCCLP